jgi:aspartate-semialdehyde dehydrogenase
VVGPVTVAGGERLTVGAVRAAAGGYSIWAAMDNLLRGGALNAVELAEEMLADSPA